MKKDHSVSWPIFLEALFRQLRPRPRFYADHPHHGPSAKSFLAAGKEGFCALQTLGEVYATLTGLPVSPRISGPNGVAIVKQIRDRLTVISLTQQEYVAALEIVSETIVVGAAYDALIARCALKAGAEVLLTWNVRDFDRLGAEVARLVKTPLEV